MHPNVPSYFEEDFQTNAAVESVDFSYDLGDTALVGEVQELGSDGIILKSRRKVYQNSDFPMLTWAEHQDEYLDEFLRLEGRGYATIYSTCGGCGKADPTYRCAQQTCYGPSLYCKTCIVSRHAVLPTHWIQEWNGSFFERRTLKSLGLVIQLGHPAGTGCNNPVKAIVTFTVIDLTGIHNVDVNFCNCDSNVERRQQLMRVCWWPATARDPQTCATFRVLRLFQILNCLGKVSAHDFLRSLELLTNNDGLEPPADRRRAFRHIVRQYRTTLMMKRAGRGHDPSGAGRNLPAGWDNINWAEMPEDLRYKYFTFVAQDCNFRLINRNISSAAKDPILNDGCGFFVNHAKYTEFLSEHVTEDEISSCSGFQAMFLANRKRVKGLRTTGVGGVTCARHNMWLPNGIGDLQLGERYCNMDFILFSAVLHTIIFYLILSYDIACQYGKNFWSQMQQLPAAMHLLVEQTRVWFKVPNFHLPPHQVACHSPYSFHYMWGAGRTHGETVEQNWEFTNGAAASTKMMGLGTRRTATLEDLFAFHNWRRLVANRRLLPKRMAENVKEGHVHRDAFEAFDAALRETAPEMVESWKQWVHDWESRQHTNGVESPFELKEKVMTMRDIRNKLAKEELLRSGDGTEVEREDTPSTFVLMGLEIEETQRHLAIDVKVVTNPTDIQALDFLKRWTALIKRIRAFRKLQRTYMPNLRRFISSAQRALWDSETERNVEEIRLFMPSEISEKNRRVKACAVGLPEVEADLRVGEAREALHALRQGLRTRTMTNRFRLRHCTGQRMLMRGQGVLRQVNLKIHKAKLRYRYSRNALKRLKGDGLWEKELQVLEDSDVRALNERALTAEEAEQRKAIHDYEDVAEEGGVAAYGVVALGEGRRTLSWIWYASRAEDPSEAELVEALRVEWCKSYARMRRWQEDVVLVKEEMRRTIEYGYWSACEWARRAEARAGTVGEELLEGLTAYAREQQNRETKTCEKLTTNWAKIREKGRAYLARETVAGVEVVVPLDDEEDRIGEGDDGEEEGPPDYEDEGDDDILE
ncbi:CxC2 domain-containing protein [Mycena venus]|uniref:CxC2 domain-containing protein n=1 Tax=Mycena venus TaxID=2733690 RepID=A0A8H6YV93_9AGAR|nr:CxC2 domain-containing protein [Mycena venus]